jgi:pyroglutamyl-peptidase
MSSLCGVLLNAEAFALACGMDARTSDDSRPGHRRITTTSVDAEPQPSERRNRRLTILITGFGPFPGAPFNPTEALVKSLAHRRRPAFADVALIDNVFRTSYAAVDVELPKLIAAHRPDVLLMFGLAARTRHLRIEMRAHGRQSVLFSDVDGSVKARRIRGIATLRGRAPFARLLTAARTERIPVGLSREAGSYLCNYVYHQALSLPPERCPRVTVFVHVPKVRRAPVPKSRLKRRSTTAADLLRAAEAILLVLATAARAR